MNVCPRCERLIRRGDMVRVSVLGEYNKIDEEGHYVHPYAEEWIEHISCIPEPWEEKFVKWTRRKFRWLKELLRVY